MCQNKKILSSAHGKIEQILMSYNGNKQILSVIIELVSTLSESAQILVWVCKEANWTSELVERFEDEKISFDFYQSTQASSAKCRIVKGDNESCGDDPTAALWIQDHFLVFENNLIPLIIKPTGDDADGLFLANELIKLGVVKFQSISDKFVFESGNILVGDDFILMGRNDFERTKVHYPLDNDNYIKQKIGKITGYKKVIIVDHTFSINIDGIPLEYELPIVDGNITELVSKEYIGEWMPDDHIDQFISLVGRSDNDDKYTLMVAEGFLMNQNDYTPILDVQNGYLAKYNSKLNNIAINLRTMGFNVIRNPILVIADNFQLLYNNVLVENNGQEKHVWLPVFSNEVAGSCFFDKENKTLWEHFGYKVHEIKGLLMANEKGGALHCISKVLVREK